MICQINPNTICYLFYIMNWGCKFTTIQPIERADSIAKFKFSILWYMFVGWMLIAYGEIGGTLPGTALFISLLNEYINYQRMIPSWTASKMFLAEMGKKCPTSLSLYKTELTWLENAYFYESKTVWITPWTRLFAIYMSIKINKYKDSDLL